MSLFVEESGTQAHAEGWPCEDGQLCAGERASGGTTFTVDFRLPEPGADKYISVVLVAQACGALQKVRREEEEDGPTGMEGWPQGKGTSGGHLREARGRPSLSRGRCLQPLSLHASASPKERFPTLTSQQAAPWRPHGDSGQRRGITYLSSSGGSMADVWLHFEG